MATAQQPQHETAPGTAVAPVQERGVVGLITSEAARRRLTPLLPRGVTVDRIAQEVYFAAKKNDDFLKARPESILTAVARGVQLDLIFGETLHLVRFKDECTLVVDYKGLAELAQRSGAARSVECDEVYEGDHFECRKGLHPVLDHVPAPAAKRGKMVGAYCVIRRGGGLATFDFMPLEDIEAIRKGSKKWGPDKVPVCPVWYARKTVARRALKLVPKNPKLVVALAAVDEAEEIAAGDYEVLDAAPSLPRAALPDLPAEVRQGPYEEAPSLDGSHVATPRERVAPRSRTVQAPGDARAALHPTLREADPYTGEPVVSDAEADQYWNEQDARGGR